MQTSLQLREQLRSIDRKSYPAYKSLRGQYRFPHFVLSIDHVQGDPFASPSAVSILVSHGDAGFPAAFYKNRLCRTTLADFLIRGFSRAVAASSFQARGSGKSGLISISRCGQEVIARTACEITDSGIIMRFFVGFPAHGRTIAAGELEKILFDYLPEAAEQTLYYRSVNASALSRAIELAEDQQSIRDQLPGLGLCAFVADGSVLPRESGVSDRPMKDSIPFLSPERLRVTMELPHRGSISGMGIPCGITLIAGGGFHGKSTLLDALSLGVYNHIAGDGREFVITDDTAVKLRAEDGRFVRDVDISMFINHLPNDRDTASFSTLDASGSTSQAAGISESIEAGARVILLDEDTSAANFMVRDAFMQAVIAREKEPITPFLERARDLYSEAGISTILVAGSSGAFFHIADTVIQMDSYRPVDITEKAKSLCDSYPLPEVGVPPFSLPASHRIMTCKKEQPSGRQPEGRDGGRERIKMKCRGRDGFSLGRDEIDLRAIEQITDSEQTAALGLLLKYAVTHLIDGKRTLPEVAKILSENLEQRGLSFLSDDGGIFCGYAQPRTQEIYACLNRYRRP